MAAESEQPEVPDEPSLEETRQYLIRFLDRQGLGEYEEIYDELTIG